MLDTFLLAVIGIGLWFTCKHLSAIAAELWKLRALAEKRMEESRRAR